MLVTVILCMLVVLFAVAGLLARRAWILGALVFALLGAVGAVAGAEPAEYDDVGPGPC